MKNVTRSDRIRTRMARTLACFVSWSAIAKKRPSPDADRRVQQCAESLADCLAELEEIKDFERAKAVPV